MAVWCDGHPVLCHMPARDFCILAFSLSHLKKQTKTSFETGCHGAQASLKLTVESRMALQSGLPAPASQVLG